MKKWSSRSAFQQVLRLIPKRIIGNYPHANHHALTVTAGFGNQDHKAIRRTSEINSSEFSNTNPSWMVLGCDGLTEKMGVDEIKSIVENNKNRTSIEIAKALVEEAIIRGSKDNISVIVIALHEMPKDTLAKVVISDAHGPKGHLISQAVCDKSAEDLLKPGANIFASAPGKKINGFSTDLKEVRKKLGIYKSERFQEGKFLHWYSIGLFSYPRQVKLDLLEKLDLYLDDKKPKAPLTDQELGALLDHRMGEIYSEYKHVFDKKLIEDVGYKNLTSSDAEIVFESYRF